MGASPQTSVEKCRSLLARYEMVRFALAASLAAVVNLGTLYLVADVIGINYLIGSSIAFVAGFAVAFVLHKWWTFQEKSRENVPHQVLLSILLKGINFVTYMGAIYLLVERWRLWHLYAAMIGGALIPIENFLAFKFVIFRPRPVETAEE